MDNNNTTPPNPPTGPGTPPSPAPPSDQVVADVPQTPPDASPPNPASQQPPFNSPQGEPPPADSMTPATPGTQAPASPWDTVNTQVPGADPTVGNPAQPQGFGAPADASASGLQSNPFLQPQANLDQGMASSGAPTPAAPDPAATSAPTAQPSTPLPEPGSAASFAPNPTAGQTGDPLNTAFSPNPAPASPFGSPANPPTDPSSLGSTPPASPWGQPVEQQAGSPAAPASQEPTTGFISGSETQEPGVQPGATSSDSTPIQDQAINPTPASGTLDLSSLQNSQPGAPTQDAAPPAPQTATGGGTPPNVPPTDNAPTDLSHLISDEDQGTPQQPMGNVYNPPVAADQPAPGTPAPQTPTATNDQPAEKHLNLTKVLLVAGIPIILIVAALSAYLILGVGRPAPEEDTSLPVEQTEQTQAPLTNPPQQITAPSPQTLPEPAIPPSGSGSASTTLPVASAPVAAPAAPTASGSPTSAMERLRSQQSPQASPAASAGTSTLSAPPTSL